MNFIFYVANAFVLPPAMHFAWNFYKYKGKEIEFRRLYLSMILFFVTVIITGLQFIFPEIIPMVDRDPAAVNSGEWWRLVTSLFIQPGGIWQFVFNGLFFVSFLPVAEHLYGRGLLLIYFGASICGQLMLLYWETTAGGLGTVGGGSSTALYGVVGALFVHIVNNRNVFPKGYLLIPFAGFVGALVLLFFEDGHAPSVLAGAVLGSLLRGSCTEISPYPGVKTGNSR